MEVGESTTLAHMPQNIFLRSFVDIKILSISESMVENNHALFLNIYIIFCFFGKKFSFQWCTIHSHYKTYLFILCYNMLLVKFKFISFFGCHFKIPDLVFILVYYVKTIKCFNHRLEDIL